MSGEHDIVLTYREELIEEIAQDEFGLHSDDVDWDAIEKIIWSHVFESDTLNRNIRKALESMKK